MHAKAAVIGIVLAGCSFQSTPALAARRIPDLRDFHGWTAVSQAATPLALDAPTAAGATGAFPRVSVSDGVGGTYVAWSEADRDNVDSDIILLRLTRAGVAAPGWPADGLPICTAAGDQFFAVGPQPLVPDGSGGVIVAWFDRRGGRTMQDCYAQRVDSAGVSQWAADGVRFRSNARDFDQKIAADGTGGMVATWSTNGGVDKDIFASRISGEGVLPGFWSTAGVPVCGAAGDQDHVVLTGDGTGGAIIAWEDRRAAIYPTHVYAQRLDAVGAPQWTIDGELLDIHFVGSRPAICSDGGTGALVFWGDQDHVNGQRLDSAGAAQWGAEGVAVQGSNNLSTVYACAADRGGAVVSWEVFETEGVAAQRVDDVGASQWGATGAAVVSSGSTIFGSFEIIPDGAGAAYFVWEESRIDVTNQANPKIYTQRIDADGNTSWAPDGVKVSGVTSGLYPGSNALAAAALDDSLGLLVAWTNSANGPADIYAQRFTPSGTTLLPDGGLLVFTYPGVQLGGGLLQTDQGGVLAFYEDGPYWDSVMRMRKFNAGGKPATAPITICPAAVHGHLSGVTEDGSGGVIVAWNDRRSGDDDIYAQRFDSNGVPQWDASGVPICVAPGAQDGAGMVTDGSGGGIIVWSDGRNPSHTVYPPNNDLYAQRIDASGVTHWAANGVAVCADTANQIPGAIVSDGAHGAIICWTDARGGSLNAIYAQRVDSSGVSQWTADGTKIAGYDGSPSAFVVGSSPGPSNDAVLLVQEGVVDASYHSVLYVQKVSASGVGEWGIGGTPVSDPLSDVLGLGAAIVADGLGGAYVAWGDDRDGIYDLYMQRFNTVGTPLWAVGGNVICNAAGRRALGGLTRDPSGDEYLTWSDRRAGLPDIFAQRVSASGLPVWTVNGVQVCGAPRGQFRATLAGFKAASPGRVFVGWADNRAGNARYFYMERLDLNGVPQWDLNGITRVALSWVGADADPERVRLRWYATENVSASVYRCTTGQAWQRIGDVLSDGTGQIVFEDRAITPGTRYGYRLEFVEEGARVVAGEAWVQVPAGFRLALDGLVPNPATSDPMVSFTLPNGDAATIELVDVAGRRVLSRELTGFGPGRHMLRLDRGGLAAGMYFVRLTQARRSITRRAAVVR